MGTKLRKIPIIADFAHFKIPYSSKNQLTYRIPPISTVIGILKILFNDDIDNFSFGYTFETDEGDNMPYVMETYSGIFAGISNIDINDISKFNVSDNEKEFRDYSTQEIDTVNIDIDKAEKYKRISTILKGLQYLSIEGNQNNYLTDTAPKIVILGEYSWGNNVFQGIMKGDGVDVDALKEALEENEDFRLSDIYIGVSSRILDEKYQGLKEKLTEELKDLDFVKVSTVKQAFDNYLEYLHKTL